MARSVVCESEPRATFEVVESELFLELLMCLLAVARCSCAHQARADRGGTPAPTAALTCVHIPSDSR